MSGERVDDKLLKIVAAWPDDYDQSKRSMARELLRRREADAWRDIETAPRDGTELLLINDDGIQVVGRWSKHNHVPLYGWIRQIELYGEEVDGFDPTHWQPLPAPPAIASQWEG